MQNEELQRVFNLSENQNHRYNGYMLPLTNDKPASKVRKLSPKKKNAPTDMVTATGKPAVKRRSKVKNCVNSDGIVNGFLTPSAPIATSSNTPTKTKCDFNPYAECFDASPFPSKFNNFIRPKPHPAAANSANHLAAKLANKDGDVELNRKRVAHSGTNNVSHVGSIGSSSKYDMLNHARPDELNHLRPGEPSSSSKASYPRAPQPNHASGEVPSKTSPNNLSSRNKVATSYLQMSVKSSGSRVDEVREKESEYRNYLPNAALAAPSATVKPEARFLDSRRAELQHQQLLDDVRMSEASSSVGTVSSKLFLRAKRWKQSRNKWQMDSGTRHEALQRIREGLDVHDKLLNDLFPLNVGETGFEESDSDSSEEYANTFQDSWFHMSEIEFDDVKRNLRLAQLYGELQRQLTQIKQNKCDLPTLSKPFMKSVVDAARTRPADVTSCMQDDARQRLTTVEPLILTKKKCAIEVCKNVALPCMPTCVRHILFSERQTLFEQCRVRDANSVQCDRPVLNIKYHYPVCSAHSKPEFVLPDFARDAILYEEVRGKNTGTLHAAVYKTDFDLASNNAALSAVPSAAAAAAAAGSSKGEPKRRNNASGSAAAAKNHATLSRPIFAGPAPAKKDKERKAAVAAAAAAAAAAATATSVAMPGGATAAPRPAALNKDEKPPAKKEALPKPAPTSSAARLPKEPAGVPVKAKAAKPKSSMAPAAVPPANRNLLPDWVNLSEEHLVDAKSLETNLASDFVNGFDMNAASIQSHIQEMINSESPLSADMLMESHDLPSYIRVEEMIEEVEVTDETLESGELNGQELVPSEDLNAVLKELPPEAFNELFSDKSDSQWTESQALERVIEEMDVRKCALIDPSLLLEDIEPSYSNYSNSYVTSLSENVDTKFNDITGNCQSES